MGTTKKVAGLLAALAVTGMVAGAAAKTQTPAPARALGRAATLSSAFVAEELASASKVTKLAYDKPSFTGKVKALTGTGVGDPDLAECRSGREVEIRHRNVRVATKVTDANGFFKFKQRKANGKYVFKVGPKVFSPSYGVIVTCEATSRTLKV